MATQGRAESARQRHGAPRVTARQWQLWLGDPERRWAGVRLAPEAPIGGTLDFTWRAGAWRLRKPLPPVSRLEYLLEVTRPGGRRERILDPANPLRAPGAFGERSEARFPGYRLPAWLGAEAGAGRSRSLELPSGRLGTSVSARVWTPDGVAGSDRLPLLLVHDGPEYDALAQLTRYLAVGARTGALPPIRAALLDPGHRDTWYAANLTYADAVHRDVVPALRAAYPTSEVIALGASLGALAWLHVQRTHPHLLDGMYLQSGSFFRPELDSQEAGFAGYRAIVGFIEGLQPAAPGSRPVPTVMTCGAIEENIANNRHLARVLAAQGYPTRLMEVRDVHNYTAWRDALDPCLADLITGVVRLSLPEGGYDRRPARE